MEELKPCRSCGGEAEVYTEIENKLVIKDQYIRCKKCHARSPGIYEIGKELELSKECDPKAYDPISKAWKRVVEAWNGGMSDDRDKRH